MSPVKTKLKWTDVPTDSGAYFVRNKNGSRFWVRYTEGVNHVQIFGEVVHVHTSFIVRWWGPVAEPEPESE